MPQYYIVLTPFFPSPTSFVGPYIYDQVKAIPTLCDYEIIVITNAYGKSESNYTYQSIRVHCINLLDLPSFIFPGLFLKANLRRLEKRLTALTNNQLDKIKFIHGHVTYPFGLLGVELAKKIGSQSIVQHHGLDVMGYTNGRLKQAWFKKLNQNWIDTKHVPILNRADWNVGVSQKTIDALRAIGGYQPTKEYVLYNGVDSTKFYPVLGLKNEKQFTIGCVANFWETKDQLTLIKAISILLKEDLAIPIKLKLIGTGATLTSCIDYVKENNLGDHVQFLPTLDHSQINAFYNSLDLFVLPSYDEAFGCVYTEAYACGVPFIAVKGQGIEELILDENIQYQLMEPKHTSDLATKIKFFCQNKNVKPMLKHPIEIGALVANFLNTIDPK